MVVGVLGTLTVAFAWAADTYHKQAEFWQALCLQRTAQLETLVAWAEETLAVDDFEEEVVRVWPLNQN